MIWLGNGRAVTGAEAHLAMSQKILDTNCGASNSTSIPLHLSFLVFTVLNCSMYLQSSSGQVLGLSVYGVDAGAQAGTANGVSTSQLTHSYSYVPTKENKH